MYDCGQGPALVVVPGIQGRWEWMKPALDELQLRLRTIAYSLAGDAGSGTTFDPSLGFDNYVRQLDGVYESRGLTRAAICGVSYGGLIALRYAARRPERVSALVLVSSPSPGWVPTPQQQRYVARPWRSLPAFVATAPGRLWPEIEASCETWRSRVGFSVAHAARVVAAPMNPSLMADRVAIQQQTDFDQDCRDVVAPTLVITGEDGLDRVVPVAVTRRYATLIAGARHVTLDRTGHLGLVTQPVRFASTVSDFVRSSAAEASARTPEEIVHANHH